MVAPHSGQSSQLLVGVNDANAQFLPKLAGAVGLAHNAQELQRVLTHPNSGQSSQLVFNADDRSARSHRTVKDEANSSLKC
jgi:hypothetical protein